MTNVVFIGLGRIESEGIMRNHPFTAMIFLLCLGFANSAQTQICGADAQRHAVRFGGEVSGKHAFTETFGPGWTFRLEPAPFGWDLRLRDGDGLDLSQITPPFRLVPNPREIYGWHFRNSTNTATNTGDVNAPQQTRLFSFSPSLSGTGGLRPSTGLVEADPNEGRGQLLIGDMGLTDLEPGQKARMNYLKFSACLSWPRKPEETQSELDRLDSVFLGTEREAMMGCGLEAEKYDLSAWALPRLLSGDFDGDGALDTAAPVVRKIDGKRGLAICRAGTWMSMFGYGRNVQTELATDYYTIPQYLEKVEYWEIRSDKMKADILVLGQIEKSEVAIGWNGHSFTHDLISHMVEP